MSRYARLQRLLKEDSSIDQLSFYPEHLLNLRSILSEWVEKQDWSEVLCGKEDSEVQAQEAKRLLGEALALLKDKTRNDNNIPTGFEFHIKNTETQLKRAYEDNPTKFVQDLCHCLHQEDQLTSKIMSQMQAFSMDHSQSHLHFSAEELCGHITRCQDMNGKIIECVQTAYLLLGRWRMEIQTKSSVCGDVFGNGRMHESPYQVFMRLKQKVEEITQKLLQELDTVLHDLEWHIKRWKTHQLHTCVSRKPEGSQGEEPTCVENMCEQVCFIVNNLLKCAASPELEQMDSVGMQIQASPSMPGIPTPSIISSFSVALRQILQKIVERFLVVIEQPDLTMMIEKEKKDKEDINNSKKFKTTIGILGGKGFGDTLEIREVEIFLAFNHDLAEAQAQNQKPAQAFKIYHDKPDRRRPSSRNLDSPRLPYQRTYEDLRVEHFSRRETKHVYKQLYHVVYNIKLYVTHLVQEEYCAQIISLPIIVRTGANQASEHIGAQLWHSFSCPNVYNPQAEMALSMKVKDVIQMMNERICFIGGRGLKQYEREFLQERLTMAANGKRDKKADHVTITVDAFIKDKVVLPTTQGVGKGSDKDTMPFSLWRWLHSIINLLVETLKDPWLDGIIYGFASREHCMKVLRDQAEGTFLLRFSESFLSGNYINSKGGLVVVIQKDGQAGFVPPINSEEIEKEGLARMIENIGCLQLLGTQYTINALLQKYPASLPETQHSLRYFEYVKKEVIVPKDSDPGTMQTTGPTVTVADRKTKKGKRRNQKLHPLEMSTSSTKQHCPTQPESPESTTSSVPSPMATSPGNGHHFKPVGLKFQTQVSCESSPPSNIPTTVLGEEQLSVDQGQRIDQAVYSQVSSAQGETMEFELPLGQELPPGEYHMLIDATGVSMPVQVSDSMSAATTSPNFLLSESSAEGILLTGETEQFSHDDVEVLTNLLGEINSQDLS